MKSKKIYIAGHTGMVGTAITKYLNYKGYNNLILRTKAELNLINQQKVNKFFEEEHPEIVILVAGRVGGIEANRKYPAEFIYQNIMMWTNIISAASNNNVKKLIFLGSATVYPKTAQVPYKEEYLLSGPFDKNVEPYAIAKISAIKLCETLYKQNGNNFFTITLANLYGPYDHFDNEDAHVVPSLISKIYDAKTKGIDRVELWGTGKPTRDLLFVEDLADAIEYLLNTVDAKHIFDQGISHINIGTGNEITIHELTKYISSNLDYNGTFFFNSAKPDGPMRKVVDISRINNLGWKANTSLYEGIKKTCDYYLKLKIDNSG